MRVKVPPESEPNPTTRPSPDLSFKDAPSSKVGVVSGVVGVVGALSFKDAANFCLQSDAAFAAVREGELMRLHEIFAGGSRLMSETDRALMDELEWLEAMADG